MTTSKTFVSILAVAAASMGLASAQQYDTRSQRGAGAMSDNGFFAEELIGSEVYGREGNRAGTVESIILDQDGMIDRLVVETGGFLDIGDYVISVDWEDIDTTPGREGIRAPISADNLEDFSLFGDRERARLSEGAFRASELMGDELRLAGNGDEGEEFGYVTDLRFSQDGTLETLIYQPDITYSDYDGYYEVGFDGYGADSWYDYDPGLDYYGVDYGLDDLGEDDLFDYNNYYDGWL